MTMFEQVACAVICVIGALLLIRGAVPVILVNVLWTTLRTALRTALSIFPGPRGWLVLLLLALGAASVLAGGFPT